MEITAAQPMSVTAPPKPAPSAPEKASEKVAPDTTQADTSSQMPPVTEAENAKEAVVSPEEMAIRAAFLAQLKTSELLTIVRDPADNILPDSPEHDL